MNSCETSSLTADVLEVFKNRPNTALLVSGSGSNAITILGNEAIRDLYRLDTIITDNPASNAARIAEEHHLQCLVRPKGKIRDSEERTSYFNGLTRDLTDSGVEATIYAGFMKISTPEFAKSFPGVNVHPADLTLKDGDGVAKYRGMAALLNMRQDMGYVASTVHVVDNPVDTGSAIAVSRPIVPMTGESDEALHSRLKIEEHVIYPATLQLLGAGVIRATNLPYSFQELMELG